MAGRADRSSLGLGAFLLSGRAAGLAGAMEVLGPDGRLVSGFLPAHGFTAVLIALVANLSVAGGVIVALFFGGLASASLYLPVIAGLPAAAIDMINAAIALFITARAAPGLARLLPRRRAAEAHDGDCSSRRCATGRRSIYVAMAGVLAQRAGIWNLGLEGLMITGCLRAWCWACTDRLGRVGFAGAIVLCVLVSALLWLVIEKLRANPIIAGLGLTGLGLGGTDLAVQAIYGSEAR